MTIKDMRGLPLQQEAEALFRSVRVPGTGKIRDAAEVHASSDGQHVVFTGTVVQTPEALQTRICRTVLATGESEILTSGPNCDRSARFSPDGRHIAFVSDRHAAGDFQLYLIRADGSLHAIASHAGSVEYFHWSPDGKRILLGVAGSGADSSGAQGAISRSKNADVPPWLPRVDAGSEDHRWRRVCVYDLDSNTVSGVEHPALNVWEAAWCGDDALAVIASSNPTEGAWYGARLYVLGLNGKAAKELYAPRDQLAGVAAAVRGDYVAVIEGVSSDRGLVAGELQLIRAGSGQRTRVDTVGIDVSNLQWCSERTLLLAGHRGLETVVGLIDVESGAFTELWCSEELSCAGFYAAVSGWNERGDCALIAESFTRVPEIAVIERGEYRVVKRVDVDFSTQATVLRSVERVRWQAPDGLEIQGWLLRPERGAAPHPVVMYVHGGPVLHWRPTWLGRRSAAMLMLLRRGYALFLPNPRGSNGRGQSFARRVIGDMGGADADDLLSGLDHLVARGVADGNRLAVTGASYGGFMTTWLITRDERFAAAVAICPFTNLVTQYLLANIPHFLTVFAAGEYNDHNSQYFQRSPLMHAHKVTTPTLCICGGLDRCTPPQEAQQFHAALREHGVESVLVTYPQEGHGVRSLPALIDYTARMVDWIERHVAVAVS